MAHDDNDDEYVLPLEDQRVFGAGIKRKRVPFVQSSASANLETTNNSIAAPATTCTSPAPSSSGASIGDKYLSIVLPSRRADSSLSGTASKATVETGTRTCHICNLPLSVPSTDGTPDGGGGKSSSSGGDGDTQPHELSLAHQVCLPHSHPPSAIDRRRTGYKYLSSYGWDPDKKRGLGPAGQGIQFPLKTKSKNDTAGLGVKPAEASRVSKKKPEAKLSAKQVRKAEEENRRKGEWLGELFYRADDVQRYLGTR